MDDREKLIETIVTLELEMFLSVPADGLYSCQQDLDGFRLHRSTQFAIWSEKTLSSYLQDLHQAEAAGINLMTVKYARMEDRLERENFNPLIDQLAALQLRWQTEMAAKYPHLMAAARPVSEKDDAAGATSFETYLRGELETYSDATLASLFHDLSQLDQGGKNGSEEIYSHLVKKLGYENLAEVEKLQQKRRT
jgi:hypothetical protein